MQLGDAAAQQLPPVVHRLHVYLRHLRLAGLHRRNGKEGRRVSGGDAGHQRRSGQCLGEGVKSGPLQNAIQNHSFVINVTIKFQISISNFISEESMYVSS